MISYIDIVHIDWVTAELEQEATRKGSGTSKRGARVVSSISCARAARRRFSESTATLRSETLGLIPSRAESRSAQSAAANTQGACESCPIRHLESQRVATPSPSPTDTDYESIMVVCYACMAWQRLQRQLLFYDIPAGGVPLREQCSVQPVSLGHSHCHPGATQQAY